MYASQVKTSTSNGLSDTQPKVPVETYENKAVLHELARRSMNECANKQDNCNSNMEQAECNCCNCEHEHIHNCDCKTQNHREKTECTNNIKTSKNLFYGFEADDALILLIIILMLTDKNENNDILVPILLGLLLLT